MKTLSAILGVGLASVVALGLSQPAQAQVTGKTEEGLKKASQCIGCHEIPGYRASFPSVYRVPMIAGQSAKYIEAALQAYKKGDRNHPTMRGIAGSLSDQDMADLAALYGSK